MTPYEKSRQQIATRNAPAAPTSGAVAVNGQTEPTPAPQQASSQDQSKLMTAFEKGLAESKQREQAYKTWEPGQKPPEPVAKDMIAAEKEQRKNYSPATHEFEKRLQAEKQPFVFRKDEQDKEVVEVQNPAAIMRGYLADKKNLMLQEYDVRRKQGYYADVSPEEIVSDARYNEITGEIINDGSPAGKFLADMNEQLKPALSAWQSKYHAIAKIAHDSHRIDPNTNTWRIGFDELRKNDDIGKGIGKSAGDFAFGMGVKGAYYVHKGLDAIGMFDAQRNAQDAGYANYESKMSAAQAGLTNTFSDIVSTISHIGDAVNSGSSSDFSKSWDRTMTDFVSVGAKGASNLIDGQLSSEIASHLETLGTNKHDIEKIKDTQTTANAVVNSLISMAGDLSPIGGLSKSMKFAGKTEEVAKSMILRGAKSRVATVAEKIGKNVIAEAATGSARAEEWLAKNFDEAVARRVMQTPEGKRLFSLQAMLDKTAVDAPVRAVRDMMAFSLNAWGKNLSDEEIHSAAASGFVFGLTNALLGKVAGHIASGNLATLSKLESLAPETKEIVQNQLQKKVQIATALSNLVANPLGGIASSLWENPNDIKKAFDWENGGRRLIVDTISGMLFVPHELHMATKMDSEHAARAYQFKKEYLEKLADLASKGEIPLGKIVDVNLEHNTNMERANQEAVSRAAEKPKVTVQNKPVEVSTEDADVLAGMKASIDDHIVDEVAGPAPVTPTPDNRGEISKDPVISKDAVDPFDDPDRKASLPEEYGSHDFIAGEKPQNNQRTDFEERYSIIYGKKFDPKNSNIVEVMEVASTPLFEGDAISKTTVEAYNRFLKEMPKDIEVHFADDVRVNGEKRPMKYSDGKLYISNDHISSGMLHQTAHTLSEEIVHAVTAPALKDPEIATKVEADRLSIRARYDAGEFNDMGIVMFNGETVPVNSSIGKSAMDYYLSSNEEFVAGAYNGNMPLAQILKGTKLDGQKRYTAFERVAAHFKGNGKEVLKAYQKMYEEAPQTHGSFDFIKSPEATFDEINKARKADELANIDHTERANDGMLKTIYGVFDGRDVTRRWNTIMRSEGPQAVIDNAIESVRKHMDATGNQSDGYRNMVEQQVTNRAKAYIKGHSNDVEQTVLAISIPRGIYQRTIPADRRNNAMGAKNVLHSNASGQPFNHFARPYQPMMNTLASTYERVKNGTHLRTFQKQLLASLLDSKPAEVQYFDHFPNKDSDLTKENGIPSNLTPDKAYSLMKDILKNTGCYALPRLASGGKIVDASRFFDSIKDLYPVGHQPDYTKTSEKGFKQGTIADVSNAVHNMVTYEWLKSYEGGKKPELADAYGSMIDIGKLLKLNPTELNSMTPEKIMQATVYDDILNTPALNSKAAKTLSERGYDGKAAYDLLQAVQPLWKDPFTGEYRKFGAESYTDKWDGAMNALGLMHMIAVDPALKSFARENKAGTEYDEINTGKMPEKYIGVALQGSQYHQIPDVATLRAVSGYHDYFDEEGNPDIDKWKNHAIHWRKDEKGGWIPYEKVACIDIEQIPEEAKQFVQAFHAAGTDGATAFVNPRAADFYNAVVGMENVGSFKNAHVASDAKHTSITKTSYANTPTRSDNPMYAQMNKFFESLRDQGFSRIKFTSAVKSSGTYELKEGRAGLPGMEDVPVFYNHKGQVEKSEVPDIAKATYAHILSGGTVPSYMVHNEDFIGKQGQSFITASEASKKNDLAFGQLDLGHAQPGHPWYDQYGMHLEPLRAQLEGKRNSVKEGYYAIKSGVIADKGYEVGTVMKDVHRHIINNMTSDDPSVRKYCSTEVLNALAKSYVNDEYGNPSATPHALAVAQMYPGLFKVGERNRHGEYKPTVFDNIMHDAVEAHEKTKIFGRSAVLVPHFFPMDAIDALAAKEKTRHEALKDPIAADFNVASLSEKHRAIYEQHIDMETGQWKPESNGVILGELEIERMNQEGRRKYGQGWKDVGFGSNIFLDLKPTDAASSNPPAVIIGMIPGSHGMSINPEMMKRMGRDLDGDRLGWIPKTPDWGMHIDPETGQMMGSNFDVLHEKMTANNLAHDDSERIINSAEYGRLSQDQAVKMLKQYSGGETNIAAKMLGARTDTKGLSPLEGAEYWKKAADADSSQGTIVSRVAAYAHMMRKDKIKSQVPHPYMRISLGEDGGNAFTNSPKTEGNNVLVKFNPDLQDVQARLSFIKQYGAVDKFNTSGVNWDDAFNSAIITHVRRANGETLTLPDYRKQYFSEYQRAMTSLNKSMAENYTGSARNIDKSSKLERFATDDAFSKAAKDVFESFPHDEVLRKKADKHLLELQGKAKQGWTKDSFRSADDARKDIMLKEQCRALLNGFKIDNNNYARIATMDNGCYVDATNSGGKFQLELVRPDFKGSIKLGMDELFNPDGSFTPKMDRLVKGYDFPIESLFSDSDDGYHSVVDQSGKFRSFLVYNNYNEESKSADVGRAIAEYARTHADPDKAATGLLLDHMARVGNQQWYNVLSSVAENGVRPVVDASIERKYGRAWVLNPATGEFDSVQRLGKKWARIAGGDESLPGEVVSSEKKTSEDGSLVTELNTVKIRQPLENRFLEETAKNLGNKEEHGSFDFGVTLKQMPIPFFRPEMVQRVFKAVDKELGMDIVKAAEDPAEYQKYFDTLKKYVDTHMSEIPEADREEALQSLNPGGSFYANMAKQATNGNHSKEFWLMSQAFGTIQGLKRLAQSQPGWKDTTVGKFILSTNNYMERTADSLVMANAEDREFINQDDMLYTPGTYLNGVHTSSGDAVNMSTQVIRGSTFKGNQSVSSAWRRFLVPHKRVEDIKRISESRIDRFKPDTSAVDGMAQGGWLQNHLPDVKLSASYDDATHELHDGATVIVGGEAFPDIHVGLDKHYSSVIENPAERKAVVNGMAAIIETQLEGMRHANSVIARARITEQMMFDNADRVTDKRMVDMSAQMVSDLVEKAEHYSSMSPLQAYHALLGTDEGKAAHIFSSLLNYGDIGMFAPIYSSDPIVQAKPDEWQNMMLWDIGRKLFDWQGEYSQGASVNEKGGYVKRDKQLNGKLAFMRNMLERKKNEIEGGSDDVISINKGFESAQESFAKVVAEQEGLPDEKTIQAITSGQIIRAMHEIATEYGVGEQFAPLLETKATPDMFAKSMRSELRDHFGKHSALSLNMYNAKPDSNDLAHQNISWKLTNAYGLTKQFAHALDVDKTVQSMRANLDGRFVTDTPDIEVGKLCLVQHALADGTQKTIKGRYVGAFIPKSLHEVIGGDGKTGFATGKTSELFATFFDDVSGTKHIVNTNNIVSMIEDTTSGWRGSLDRRITKDKLRAPEFMKILSENSSLYHDMYGEQADFRVSKNGRNSLAELMQDKGVRNVGMMRDIEKFMFDSAKTAQIVGMYLGGKQMAGIGVGLGMMALGIPGGAPIATTAAISLGKKITVNLMSNLFTGTRNEYLFEGGKALNVLSPIYDRIHGVFRSTKDLVSTGQQTDGQVPLNVAAVQQKMAEGREATELQQEYGIEARPRDYKDELSALMLMKRYDQRFQALYDEEYSEQRTEMMQRIKQIKKNSDTYKDDLASIMKEFSWENYATKMLPKESAVLAMKGISVSESDGKVTFHGEAGIVDRAMDHYEKLSGVHKRIFDAYMSAASTGNPGMQAVGNILAHTDSFASRIANISKYAMKIPTMTEAVSASGADTSARRVVDGVEEMMVSRGFEPLNPTLKENLVASTATLSSGQYEGNQTTKNTLLGARAVCFQGFQQPMKTYTYGQHSDLASQYKFFRDAVKNDSAMRKYMTDVGIVTPEGVIWDKNRQLTRTMVTSFAFKAAGAAANALLTIALMKLYQASGDSEDEAVIKTKQNEVLKMQEKLQTYTDPLVRVLATDSDVPDALETMLGWIATKAPTHIMVETAQMRNKGKGKKLVAGTEAMIESDLKDDEWKMGTLSRLGGAPDVSNTLHLIGDGLMFAFLHNEAMRTRYADLISSSQASKVNARKVRQNTLDALEVQRDMQKWKIVERAADFVSPGLGGSISNAILHSEEMRAEARKEAKKN